MQLARIRLASGEPRVAAWVNGKVVDLQAAEIAIQQLRRLGQAQAQQLNLF